MTPPPQNVSANSVSIDLSSAAGEAVPTETIPQKILASARALFDKAARSQRIVTLASAIPGFIKLVASTKAWVKSRNNHASASTATREIASASPVLASAQSVSDVEVIGFAFAAASFTFLLASLASLIFRRKKRVRR